jgi:hypothetical protein
MELNFLKTINNILGGLKVVTEWMKSDVDDMASRILIDWEIVDSIQEEDGSGRKKIWKEMMN